MSQFPGLCDRPQNHVDFLGARVCDRCGWARRHHAPPPRFRIREYPNKREYGMACDEAMSGKVIGAQLELWQMVLVCRLTGGDFWVDRSLR